MKLSNAVYENNLFVGRPFSLSKNKWILEWTKKNLTISWSDFTPFLLFDDSCVTWIFRFLDCAFPVLHSCSLQDFCTDSLLLSKIKSLNPKKLFSLYNIYFISVYKVMHVIQKLFKYFCEMMIPTFDWQVMITQDPCYLCQMSQILEEAEHISTIFCVA